MKKSVSIMCKIKGYLLARIKNKWWWLYQVNDIILVFAIISIVAELLPTAINTILLVVWLVLMLYLGRKVDKEIKNK